MAAFQPTSLGVDPFAFAPTEASVCVSVLNGNCKSAISAQRAQPASYLQRSQSFSQEDPSNDCRGNGFRCADDAYLTCRQIFQGADKEEVGHDCTEGSDVDKDPIFESLDL